MPTHTSSLVCGVVLTVSIFLGFTSLGFALEVNSDGLSLLAEATQTYTGDMIDRPVITNPVINRYVSGVVKRLVPKNKPLPKGVDIHLTIIDTPKPELYAYMDGHIVITDGMVFSMENEAQLAGLLSRQVAHLVEGYYINLYQEIKAAERHERRKAMAGAILALCWMSPSIMLLILRKSIRPIVILKERPHIAKP